ncbi:MAG: cyclic nucleotide-binding domain-containing protein [Actinomycetota bacterium]
MFTNEKQVFFPSGSVLFREGEKADGAYFIITGEVASSMESPEKGTLPLGRVESPAYLALVDSIAGEHYSCTTRALRDTRGIFIPRTTLLSTISSEGANLELLKAVAEEVSGSYEELRTVRDKFCGRSASRKHTNIARSLEA